MKKCKTKSGSGFFGQGIGCVASAASIEEIKTMLRNAGFICTRPKDAGREFIRDWVPGGKAEVCVASFSRVSATENSARRRDSNRDTDRHKAQPENVPRAP